MANSTTGVEANHVSTEKSVATTLDHAQADDRVNDSDSNISDTNPTGGTLDWRAGPMSAWQENDDYRQFFEGADVAESATTHRFDSVRDGDYDDNWGVPSTGSRFDAPSSPPPDHVDPYRDQVPIGVNALIVRRV